MKIVVAVDSFKGSLTSNEAGKAIEEGINLVPGNTIRVVKESVIGNNERFSVNHPEALDSLEK